MKSMKLDKAELELLALALHQFQFDENNPEESKKTAAAMDALLDRVRAKLAEIADDACRVCRGTGRRRGERCPICGGSGRIGRPG